TGYTVNGANQTGSSLLITGGTNTFLKGDIVTLVGSNAVHPETKADLGYLRTFAVTADSGASATALAISPAIVVTGAKQNVTATSRCVRSWPAGCTLTAKASHHPI